MGFVHGRRLERTGDILKERIGALGWEGQLREEEVFTAGMRPSGRRSPRTPGRRHIVCSGADWRRAWIWQIPK